MDFTSTLGMTVVLGIVFFLIPYIPKGLLFLTDNFIVRILLLVSLVAAIHKNPVFGIVYFLVLAHLFIQRNAQKFYGLQKAMKQSSPEDEAIQNIVAPPTAPLQPAFDVPESNTIKFMPDHDSGDNSFHAIAESIDHKEVLPTESVDGSKSAIDQLFSEINPNLE
jgi:hypothetical protein